MSAGAAERISQIPGTPLAIIGVGLLLAALPIAPRVPLFALALFLLALIARTMIHRMRLRLPPLPVKLAVLAFGVGGVAMSTGTLQGIDSGLGILLILISLKLLELRTTRDFQVLVLLGWFLGLCRLFFAQDLGSWLQSGAVGLLLTGALIAVHGGSSRGRELARTTGAMALQAAPLAAVLFVLFPRAYTGVRFSFSRGLLADTGMADEIKPGSFAGLARNDAKAFRVEFPDGEPPPPTQRYWRAGVLWKCDSLVWTRGSGMPPWDPPPRRLDAPGIRQRILVQPHGNKWLFALDWPVTTVREATFEAGEFLRSNRGILQPLLYEVTSQPTLNPASLRHSHRVAALQLPNPVPPRAAALARRWRESFQQRDAALVSNALQWIAEESFSYTLAPGDYDAAEGLEEFLFDRRAGFCEHYAASFATLMRLADVPARLVIGYHGGELNELGDYLIVRQSDAHAWCEVWLEGRGWTRIDPTSVIAPDRVAAGLQSLLQSRADRAGGGLGEDGGFNGGWGNPWRQAGMVWDNLNYQWDVRVLNFDQGEQRTFLARVGLGDLRGFTSILVVALIVIGAIAAVGVFLRRPWQRFEDPVLRGYRRFCLSLADAGIVRRPSEGPNDFAERAAGELPEQADFIRRITELYIRLRYSAAPPSAREFLREVAALPRFARLTGAAPTSPQPAIPK